jgi:hypothetical protein
MQARGKEFFAGKTPILASGTNDPTQVEFIEKSAAFLREAGVKGMIIPGVGPKVPGGQAAADTAQCTVAGHSAEVRWHFCHARQLAEGRLSYSQRTEIPGKGQCGPRRGRGHGDPDIGAGGNWSGPTPYSLLSLERALAEALRRPRSSLRMPAAQTL